MGATERKRIVGLALRVAVFAFLALVGMVVFVTIIFNAGGYLVGATLGTFASAAVANAIALRIWEQGRLSHIGLSWTPGSGRNIGLGLAGGVAAALLVTVGPLLTGAAELKPLAENPFNFGSLVFVSVVLLFGAAGEELLFRGYGFQVLVAVLGPYATVLPVAVLFGLAHANNQNVTALGLFNTILWGVVFGYAFLRSGDLWLPIALHFGWNWTLPLFGTNLSGFTMGITGCEMQWNAGELWSGGNYGPEGGLLTTAVLIPLFVFLYKAPIRPQTSLLLQSLEESS